MLLLVVVEEAEVSFQTKTLESYEHDARMEPKDGWAQDICQMGAVWLFGCVVDVVVVVVKKEEELRGRRFEMEMKREMKRKCSDQLHVPPHHHHLSTPRSSKSNPRSAHTPSRHHNGLKTEPELTL